MSPDLTAPRYLTISVLTTLGVTAMIPAQSACAADYKELIARSLNYYDVKSDQPTYSISQPWTNLLGHQMACVRRNVPDGAGGHAPTSDFSMYEFTGDRITALVKDNTLFGCPNRTYVDLPPTRH
jgi:hypothetical protein